jgi:hypothetical protein
MSDIEPDRSESDFDRDDELRALLRSSDPAGSLSPADPAALASLLEDIMSADLDVRPALGEGGRATGTHGRNRLTWLVAAAAVAAIAAGGAFAVDGLSGGNGSAPQAGPEPATSQSSDTHAGIAGETTTLAVADQKGKCAVARPELLAQYDQAFQGTVTSIEGDTVTLSTTEVLNGEIGETVQVSAPSGLDAMLGTVHFEVGGSYLVAAYDGQLSQCYSGSATGELQSPFAKAFVH